MYDVSKLRSPAECRTVLERARKQGLTDVYNAVFRRFCELAGKENEDPTDPLVRDFFETLAAYEQLLTDAMNGDAMLFMRDDQDETAWSVIAPILDNDTPVHQYDPGTWGPEQAGRLTADVGGWLDLERDHSKRIAATRRKKS